IGLAAMIWQMLVLPRLPATETVSTGKMFGLLSNRSFVVGMAATCLVFMGMNALSIYLRPFLEGVTGLGLNSLSLMLFGVGLGGLVGTSLVGFVLRRHLAMALVGMPGVVALIALLLIALGTLPWATAVLLVLWGFFSTPVPVAWNTWMARLVPGELESAGGFQVALIQLSIAGGAFAGGILFDTTGWWSAFLLAALLLFGSAVLGAVASRRIYVTPRDNI
ncbi:MAG: MFS transporter, partial [Rhizobiaceae bacterium]|nr:MFS transporter [Rhizobiaceae bacterium]